MATLPRRCVATSSVWPWASSVAVGVRRRSCVAACVVGVGVSVGRRRVVGVGVAVVGRLDGAGGVLVIGGARGVAVFVRRGVDDGGNGERDSDGSDRSDWKRPRGPRLVTGPEGRCRGDDGDTREDGGDGVGEAWVLGLLQPVDPGDPDEAGR